MSKKSRSPLVLLFAVALAACLPHRTLIVEVSGTRKAPGPTIAKAETARNQWCAAVNNHAGYGRWGYRGRRW